jgi:hypothetical protein
MSGIINAQPQPGDAGPPAQQQASGGLNNPLLAQTEARLEGNFSDPQVQQDYKKIVVAGLHIALANGPRSFMAKLLHSRDPIGDCARSAAALVMIMRRQSRGVMPIKAMVPAGLTLMLHGLDFIDRAKIMKVAEPQLDQATRIYTNEIFHKLGITTQMIERLGTRVHQVMQDPQAMQAINLKAGLTRVVHQPTPLPGAPAPTPAPAPAAARPGGRG